jgi:hypothetical protein
MISRKALEDLYTIRGDSSFEVAKKLKCSTSQVNYWLKKYKIKKRNISEAIYLLNNPDGDPFVFKKPEKVGQAILFGLGVGLYWGEGTKADKSSLRLGNTDPQLILSFVEFMESAFSVSRKNMRFSLQIFSDMPEKEALDFWIKKT